MKNPLLWRYATQKFDVDRKVPEQIFEELLEALRLSPSSFGLQPWKFIVITDPVLRKNLRLHAANQSQITDASHLIILCSRVSIDETYIKNYLKDIVKTRGVSTESLAGEEASMVTTLRHFSSQEILEWIRRQVYLALGILLSECAHREVDTCPMEGFDPRKFDEVLGLKDQGLQATVLCAIGYRAKDDLSAELKKVRFPREDVTIFLK